MNIDIYFFGIVHGVRGEFPDDVSGPTAAGPETSSGNSRRTPCKIPYNQKSTIFSTYLIFTLYNLYFFAS
jgi:hypothetical protein